MAPLTAATRVRSTSVVGLPPETLPPAPAKIHSSAFDNFYLSFPSIKPVLLYPSPSLPFAAVAANLKSSLSLVLPHFFPLGGTLTADPAGGEGFIVDCSSVAVQFIEAETDIAMDSLITSDLLDKDAFLQLVPEIDVHQLPAPAMAVQLTEFAAGGGLALALHAHHGVVDGRGLWQFLDAWKKACKNVGAAPAPEKTPVHDRAAVVNAPPFPVNGCIRPLIDKASFPVRKTFVLTVNAIDFLKQKLAPANSGDPAPPLFSVLMAHVWVSLAGVRDDGVAGGADFGAIFFVDCRRLLRPPADDAYTGNCFAPAYVKMAVADLTGPDGLSRAHKLILDALDAVNADPVKYVAGVAPELASGAPPMLLAGSPASSLLGSDFGWGVPGRCEVASFNYGCQVAFSAGKEAGTVKAAVSLAGDKMKAFEEMFLLKIKAAAAASQ